MPTRPGRWPQIDRGPLDEAVGQSILKHPLLRSAREQPEIAVPWIVLGLVSAGAYLYAGVPAALLVLLFGLPILHARTAITPNAAATQATISALSARHSVRGGPLMT